MEAIKNVLDKLQFGEDDVKLLASCKQSITENIHPQEILAFDQGGPEQ